MKSLLCVISVAKLISRPVKQSIWTNMWACLGRNHIVIIIQKEHTHIPDGTASNTQLECQAYNQLLDSLGGIELLVLGLGHDGHIGFNEPGTSLEGRTHCTELTKRTIDANQRFFKDRENMPKKAITMGLRDIMAARRILLLVSGIEKAETVRAALTGPITLEIPASVLQLHHQVSVILDAAAASALTN